ncbi:MAG: hypothetical protein ABIJ97_06010, partial [Bacteroidota bacterium]
GLTILLYYFFNKPVNWKSLIKNALFYSAGVGIAYGVIILIIYRYDAIDEMWYWTIDFAKNYVSEFPWSEGVKQLKFNWGNITDNYSTFWALATIGLFLVLFTKKTIFFKVTVWIIAIFSCLTIFPGLRFYGHYWIQLTPVLAILTGIAFYAVFDLLKRKYNPNYLNILLLLVFIIISIGHLKSQKKYYFEPEKTQLLREVYGMNPFPESKVVADFIKERTEKDDLIAVLGSEPQIYFYTNRRCASKHHYITFLMGDTVLFPMNKTYQSEFINDIETKKPKYLIYFRHYISWLRHPSADTSIDNWFNDFSNKNYNLVGVADMLNERKTNYVWYDEVFKYQPKGEYIIGVFEIKNEADTIANRY